MLLRSLFRVLLWTCKVRCGVLLGIGICCLVFVVSIVL